jgi:MoaA/NifB/PqqE/SkfB family radical SAM enzyme
MWGFWTNFSRRLGRRLRRRHARRFLSIELANICNLHCAYCLRDEDMLYGRADFPTPDRIFEVVDAAATEWKNLTVTFTGGEPLLHPQFAAVLRGLTSRDVPFRLVTNGWHFDRGLPALVEARDQVQAILFSLDGATEDSHDAHRGRGSFERVVRAMASAREHRLPFQTNIVLRRDTFASMAVISEMSARHGAGAVNFGAMFPTSHAQFVEHTLSRNEELVARAEATRLTRALKIPVRMALGLHDPAPGAHCSPLKGALLNVDHRGQLSLCGVLSSFRGGGGAGDLLYLERGDFRAALARASAVGQEALRDRDGRLAECGAAAATPSVITGSPCLSCLRYFGKIDPKLASTLGAEMMEMAAR